MALSVGSGSHWSSNRTTPSTNLTNIDFTQADFSQVLFILIASVKDTPVNVPSGWSQITQTGSSGLRLQLLYKYAPTGNITFTYSGSRYTAYKYFTVFGADTLTPITQPAAGISGTSQSLTTGTITTNGGSGDWLLTYAGMWIPTSVDNTQSYSMDNDFAGGQGGIPATTIATSGQGNANGGVHLPRAARTEYTTPGSTLGNYSMSLNAGTWPSGANWLSNCCIIKASSPSSGRRFFMIV